MRKCYECHVEYEPFNAMTKWCSVKCRQIARKRYVKHHREKILNEIKHSKGIPSERVVSLRYTQYKKGAKRRGHSFNLSIEYFSSFWNKNCFYCNRIIFGIGLDRFDNSIGYEENNIVSCCPNCNHMKMAVNGIEFINHCKKIASVHI